jgi:hypothetical protein
MAKRPLAPIVLSCVLGGAVLGRADTLHVAADTTVAENDPNAVFGGAATVAVRDAGTYRLNGYARFDLSSLGALPPGRAVRHAALRLWVGQQLTAGSIAVYPVLGTWDEGTLTWNTTPTLGGQFATVALTANDALRYATVDVTPLVQGWLNGSVANHGLALLPDTGGVAVDLDSKESASTSHPMELEVVVEDSGGDVTAVNTPGGGGLQGGAGSGDISLGLLTTCASGNVLKWSGTAWACAVDSVAAPGSFWGLTGNSGTTPGAQFLGTSDYKALELRVYGVRALRIEPMATSTPNLIGGYSGNYAPGVTGAVIGGGGAAGGPNNVRGNYGVVGGGVSNWADLYGAVGGGLSNHAGLFGSVGGGNGNEAIREYSTVGGGQGNRATGWTATVPGGAVNSAGGDFSFAGGKLAVVRDAVQSGDSDGDEGTFVWSGRVGLNDPPFSSSGPGQFLISAPGGVAVNTNTPTSGAALTVNGNTSTSGDLDFGARTRQMINLWSTAYGIGVQAYSMYYRTDYQFSWFRGGVHNDGTGNPGGGTRQMRLDGSGNLLVRGTVAGGGADFAEMLAAEDGLAPGDVLAIGTDGRLTRSTEPYQDTLAGVYSTKPGLLGGAEDGADLAGKVPLAVSGVIPVKVTDENGPIVPGDALTSSSTPGRAMKASRITVGKVTFYPSGVILGKALERHDSGDGVIQALVILQ